MKSKIELIERFLIFESKMNFTESYTFRLKQEMKYQSINYEELAQLLYTDKKRALKIVRGKAKITEQEIKDINRIFGM